MKLTKFVLLLACCFLFHPGANAQRNPNNPYDKVGELHNYLLDAFFNEQTQESIAGRWSQQMLADYICRKLPELNCPFVHEVMGDKLMSEIKDKTLLESETFFLDRGFVHARHEYYIQQINAIIEDHFEEDYGICYKALLNLEDQLVNDPDLTPSEIINILCSSSVARYSIKFWKDISIGNTRYPSIANDMTNLGCCSWVKRLSQSDVRGAVGGAIIGAGSGGGVSIPAGGAGALVGGSSSSIISGVTSLWNALF